jgi:hypothetical protein
MLEPHTDVYTIQTRTVSFCEFFFYVNMHVLYCKVLWWPSYTRKQVTALNSNVMGSLAYGSSLGTPALGRLNICICFPKPAINRANTSAVPQSVCPIATTAAMLCWVCLQCCLRQASTSLSLTPRQQMHEGASRSSHAFL